MVDDSDSETLVSSHSPSSITGLHLSPSGNRCFIGTNVERAYFYSLETSPPLYLASLQATANCCEIDWHTGLIISAGDSSEEGKDGILSLHKFSNTGGGELKIEPILLDIQIGKGACCLKFSQARSEVYIGYDIGVIGVVSLRELSTTLICRFC